MRIYGCSGACEILNGRHRRRWFPWTRKNMGPPVHCVGANFTTKKEDVKGGKVLLCPCLNIYNCKKPLVVSSSLF
jgi:hypothetical protein